MSTLTRWHTYWGAPTNAATLGPTLTRKAHIIEQRHGVRLVLIQGSPSWSSKSGGTHAGKGNAADFALTGDLKRDLAISQDFRTLNCVCYVRGQDVNLDGTPDDTFGPHFHIIDLDNPALLTSDQRWQLDLYRRGLNGLANRLRDLEGRPRTTHTLNQWLINERRLDMTEKELQAALTRWAQSPSGRVAINRAVWSGATYGDQDGDGKPDTMADIMRKTYQKLRGRK